MYIEKIDIGVFGALKSRSFDMSDGINVITGSNEAGKSTVSEFVKYIFYGFPSKTDREKYLSLENGSCYGSITLNHGAKRYRIERKNAGAKDPCVIYDLESGKPCFEDRVPGEVFFGMPLGLFVSSSFVGQISGSKINGKATSELIDNLLFAADEGVNVKKALKKLDDERITLLYKNKKGGRIFDLTNDIASYENSYGVASENGKKILACENRIRDFSVKLKYEEKQLTKYQNGIADYRLKKSREKKEKLASLENSYNSAVSDLTEYRSKYERKGFFPDLEYVTNLKNCALEIDKCNDKIEKTQKRLDVLNREMEINLEKRQRQKAVTDAKIAKLLSRRTLVLAAGVISLILCLIGFGFTAYMFITQKTALGIVLGVLSGVMFTSMIVSFGAISGISEKVRELESQARENDDGYTERLDVIRETLDEQKREKQEYNDTLNSLCARWNVVFSKDAVEEMVTVINENRRLEKEQEEARIRYALAKTEYEEGLSDEPEDDGREIDLPDTFDLRESENKAALITEMIRLKTNDKQANEVELASLKAVSVLPAEILEKLKNAEEERASLEIRHNACVMAYETIDRASQKMRASVSPRLSSMASEKMDVLSNGKYSDIKLDSDLGLSFMPYVGEGRVIKDDTYMSAGTSDIAYISLRLALSKLLSPKDCQCPIFLDESFCRLDNNRLKNMLKMLSGEDNQTLIFTSNGRENEILTELGSSFNAIKM